MLRSRFVRSFAAALLLAIAAPVSLTLAAAAEESAAKPESQTLTAVQKFNRRYPQPVKAGFLVGLPMLDGQDSTLGYIREVVRTPEGKIVLVVRYRAWLGWAPTDWGRKTVAVPIETVAIQARQVTAVDFSREDFAAAPPYAMQGMSIPANETIRIAVSRR